MVPPLITLEEHFFADAVGNSLDEKYAEQFKAIPLLEDQLRDLGDLRLSYMDKGKVSFQVISHGPGTMTAQQCHDANDQLAAAVRKKSNKFAGFAVLPMSQPNQCGPELERTVTQHGFDIGSVVPATDAPCPALLQRHGRHASADVRSADASLRAIHGHYRRHTGRARTVQDATR